MLKKEFYLNELLEEIKIKQFIVLAMLILVPIIHHIKSKKYGYVLKNCTDEEVNNSFKVLTVTGVEFITRVLKGTNFNLVILNKMDRGAEVKRGKVYIDQGFKQILSVDTFRDSLHEFRHVKDYSKLKWQKICFAISLLGIISLLITKMNIIDYALQVGSMDSIREILLILVVASTATAAGIRIMLERSAIKYPVENCQKYLEKLDLKENEIYRIEKYLKQRIDDEISMYTINIISMNWIVCAYALALF